MGSVGVRHPLRPAVRGRPGREHGGEDFMSEPRTILITGATDGLGRALASGLAADGGRLLLHGRDQARLDAAADEIAAEAGGARPLTVLADFADLAQVRAMTGRVLELTDRLDA